jgi:NAD(P)-dependent dehydrogenase (short-subunit alcohol dehydrogenase family)
MTKAVSRELEGKVALVTGGASGIGLAAVRRFADAGAKVAIADLNQEAGELAAQSLIDQGANAMFIRVDVTKSAEVSHMVDMTVDRFGGLDVAFNNAGIEGKLGTPAAEVSEEDWGRIINVNLNSVWLCMKYEIRYMAAHGGGVIVNTSSTAGVMASINSGVAYAASKHGVIGLTKTAAKEYLGQNIRINAICPGGVATRLLERTIGVEEVERLKAATGRDRISTPEQLAEAVLWLSSPASAFVVGQALVIDGGRLL